MPGRTIGKFLLLDELGRGGTATVYRAREAGTGREVALKLLALRPEREVATRFLREAAILSRLDHPNIVRIYDVAEDGEYLFYSLEYVRGRDLGLYLLEAREGGPRLPAGSVLQVACDLLGALGYLHRLGLYHRDVKPANLLLDQDGRAKLSDFGLARFRDLSRVTKSGDMMGTVRYMSPEQLGAGDVDHRSDLYQAGLVLYELVYGGLPFEQENAYALAMQRASRELPVPSTNLVGLPEGVGAVLRRACAPSPADRFQDAADFAAALLDLAQQRSARVTAPRFPEPSADLLHDTASFGGGLHPRGDPTGPPTGPDRARSTFAWAALGVLGWLLAAALFFGYPGRSPREETLLEGARRQLAAGAPAQAASLVALHLESRPALPAPEVPEVTELVLAVAEGLCQDDREWRQARRLLAALAGRVRLTGRAATLLAGHVQRGARALAADGRTTEALDVLGRAAEAGALPADGALLQGELEDAAGRPAEARRSLELALQLDPALVRARLHLGRLDAAAGLWDPARRNFQLVLAAEPTNVEAALELAALALGAGDAAGREEAARLLAPSPRFELAPREHQARRLSLLARLERAAGHPDAALAAEQEADRLAPSWDTKRALAAAFAERDDEGRALSCLRDALAVRPRDADLLRALHDRCFLRGGEPVNVYLDGLGEVAPDQAELLRTLDRSYLEADARARGAVESTTEDASTTAAERVLSRWPDDPLAHYVLALRRLEQGRRDDATAHLAAALAACPGNAALLQLQAEQLEEAGGRDDEAVLAWRRVLTSAPHRPGAALALGRLLARLRRYEEALELAAEASTKWPGEALFVADYAEAAMELGRTPEGVRRILQFLGTPAVERRPSADEVEGRASAPSRELRRAADEAKLCGPLVAGLLRAGHWSKALDIVEEVLGHAANVTGDTAALDGDLPWVADEVAAQVERCQEALQRALAPDADAAHVPVVPCPDAQQSRLAADRARLDQEARRLAAVATSGPGPRR